jgi:hypothetical protein
MPDALLRLEMTPKGKVLYLFKRAEEIFAKYPITQT